MIQSGFGDSHRNFELVKASSSKGFIHYRQDSATPNIWNEMETVFRDRTGAPDQTVVGQPLIITSSFNRDFEVIYLAPDNTLRHWYYSQSAAKWYDVNDWLSYIGGYPGYTQQDDSSFSLVVKRTDNTLVEVQNPESPNTCALINKRTVQERRAIGQFRL
jgi:hypothetical protein